MKQAQFNGQPIFGCGENPICFGNGVVSGPGTGIKEGADGQVLVATDAGKWIPYEPPGIFGGMVELPSGYWDQLR